MRLSCPKSNFSEHINLTLVNFVYLFFLLNKFFYIRKTRSFFFVFINIVCEFKKKLWWLYWIKSIVIHIFSLTVLFPFLYALFFFKKVITSYKALHQKKVTKRFFFFWKKWDIYEIWEISSTNHELVYIGVFENLSSSNVTHS